MGSDHGGGEVYFIQDLETDRIKIGFSVEPKVRIKQVATKVGRPVRLLGSAPGTFRSERELHRRFADSAEGSEWFRPTDDLLAHIRDHAVAISVPDARPGRRKPIAAEAYSPLGRLNSEALRRLHVAMDERQWSARDFGKALGVDAATPHKWLWAQSKPGLDLALKIEVLLGIPMKAWCFPPGTEIK